MTFHPKQPAPSTARRARVFIASALVAASLAAPAAAAVTELTFGVVPQQSASRLAKTWGPLMAHLSEELGVQIQFRTTKDIPTFEACLAAGAFDLAYMNPYHYAVFAADPGYVALAHQTGKRLKGLMVVRKDSAIDDLTDLDGETIAFPSPGAFGASVLPRAEMSNRGMKFTPSYVKSHDSVYRAVVSGLAPAGGGVLRTYNAISEELRAELRVVYQTESYTPHAIAALPDVPKEVRTALRTVLMRIAEERPDLAKQVGMAGFDGAADADWDDVRGLSLNPEDAGLATKGELTCPSG